ncbi:TPA: hypothetical protein ACHGDV_000563 [Escherichia coli]|uniref:hypothetical protein n=1 Tax=Escherichia coli TaxID=562 RepID=UPI001CD9FEA7|nr:hypothetical protein [Escherichia coli]MCA2055267.1 hypothetical protein [Escherichia coli]MCA2081083.1 hypothetical protein [Escherichia coli]MCA2122388.1 hypothetical protein [Escherichia coli]
MTGNKILGAIKKTGTALMFIILLIFVKIIATEFVEPKIDDVLSNKEDADKIASYLKNELSKKKFPIKVDDYTTLIATTVEGNTINHYYNLYGVSEDMAPFFDGEEIKNLMSPEIQKKLNSGECKMMQEYNYIFKYHYNIINTKYNDLVIIMTKSNCPQ